ncbi:MAG TPA: hypothetical protein VFS36_02575 [Chitinophagaceae bacterium]|jgi:hypothetical protein|nr:hypothetical protein [Chitinophagaceae bacterium]
MKSNIKIGLHLLWFVPAFAALLFGCKKNSITTPDQSLSLFGGGGTTLSYFVMDDPNSSFKIGLGVTKASNVDRVINFTISSPSGAQEGAQYTIDTKSVTIPAGKVVDSVTLKGIFDGIPVGVKDTLIFKINGGDVDPLQGVDQLTVVMQKYCSVDLNQFSGTYNNQDYFGGAPDGNPYTVTITPGTATGSKGYILVSGLWGFSIPLVKVELDWSDPSNFTTYVPTALWFVHPTYGQATIRPSGYGTFSSCDNSFTINYETTVAAGSFGRETSVISK